MKGRRVARIVLAASMSAGWCLALQVGGAGGGVAFADPPGWTTETDPIVDPTNPGTLINPSDGSLISIDSVLAEDGSLDVGADAVGGTLCEVGGLETVGAACIAGGVIAGAAGLYTGGDLLYHALWGHSHTSGSTDTVNDSSCGPANNDAYNQGETGTLQLRQPSLDLWSWDQCDWEPAPESGCGIALDGGPGSDEYPSHDQWTSGTRLNYETAVWVGAPGSDPSTWVDVGGSGGELSGYIGGSGAFDPTSGGGMSPIYVDPYYCSPTHDGSVPSDVQEIDVYDLGLCGGSVGAGFCDGFEIPGVGQADHYLDVVSDWTREPATFLGNHQWHAVVTCSSGGDSVEDSPTFTDADTTPQPMHIPPCGAGAFPTQIDVTDVGTSPHLLPGIDWQAPPEWNTPADPYVECDPGGADLPCPLRWQEEVTPQSTADITSSSGVWLNCRADTTDEGCPALTDDLATETDASLGTQTQLAVAVTSPAAGTETFRCMWGPYHVEAKDCFDAGSMTTPDPTTVTTPVPVSGSDDCFPSGWGLFNPIEWVEKPVKCALVWAFEPSPTSVKTDLSTMSSSWDTTPPGVATATAGTLAGALGGVTAGTPTCAGPNVSMTLPGTAATGGSQYLAFHPFSMCNPVGLWVHNYVIPFSSALCYIAAAFICVRVLGKTVDYETPFTNGGTESV